MQCNRKRSSYMAIHKVEENDDLLISILVGLPPKSVFRFRCVSKRWNKMLVAPLFLKSYSTRWGKVCRLPSALIQRFSTFDILNLIKKTPPTHMAILPVSSYICGHHSFKQIPSRFGLFIDSSNGLILCGSLDNYHVLNPLSGVCVSLPPPSVMNGRLASVALVCEENTYKLVPDYRVVVAPVLLGQSEDYNLPIETYSSKTRAWAQSTLIGSEKFEIIWKKPPFVSNGVFHWWSCNHKLTLYDSNDCGGNKVQLIGMPKDASRKFGFQSTLTRSSIDDILWCGTYTTETMSFWMLPKSGHSSYWRSSTIPASEWILMHKIDLKSIHEKVLSVVSHEHDSGIFSDLKNSEDIKLEALIPSNSIVALISLGEIICLYNLESMSIELVRYHGSPIEVKESGPYEYRGFRISGSKYEYGWCPYVESFSLSSYALHGDSYF